MAMVKIPLSTARHYIIPYTIRVYPLTVAHAHCIYITPSNEQYIALIPFSFVLIKWFRMYIYMFSGFLLLLLFELCKTRFEWCITKIIMDLEQILQSSILVNWIMVRFYSFVGQVPAGECWVVVKEPVKLVSTSYTFLDKVIKCLSKYRRSFWLQYSESICSYLLGYFEIQQSSAVVWIIDF